MRNDTSKVVLYLRVLIPTLLLLGGLVLLILKFAGWSIILGIPLTVIGSIFLIYEYDNLVSGIISVPDDNVHKCVVCNRLTKSKQTYKSKIVCPYCRWDLDRDRPKKYFKDKK